VDPLESQVSHTDLYHKLGKLEGLMETMMASVSTFQLAIRDIHGRIDTLEKRQAELEKNRSSQSGAYSAMTILGKDFLVPIVAIIITWFVAKDVSNTDNIQNQIQDKIQQQIETTK
jgi:E3 ubiquitin-protein ligase DOA10